MKLTTNKVMLGCAAIPALCIAGLIALTLVWKIVDPEGYEASQEKQRKETALRQKTLEAQKAEKKAKAKEEWEAKSPAEKTQIRLHRKLGEKPGMLSLEEKKWNELRSVEWNEGSGMLEVEFRAPENFGESLMWNSAMYKIADCFEVAFQEEVPRVEVRAIIDWKDTYGNVEAGPWITCRLTQEEAQLVNWKNMGNDPKALEKLLKVKGKYWRRDWNRD